jgi:hypothetical protein
VKKTESEPSFTENPQEESNLSAETQIPPSPSPDDYLSIPTPRVYDFLYKDTERLYSYASQLFGSHVIQIEDSSSSQATEQNAVRNLGRIQPKIGINIPGITTGSAELGGYEKSLDKSTTTSESMGRREQGNPHDSLSVKIINRLIDAGAVYDDVHTAPNGGLISMTGEMKFMEEGYFSFFIEMMTKVNQHAIKAATKPSKRPHSSQFKPLSPPHPSTFSDIVKENNIDAIDPEMLELLGTWLKYHPLPPSFYMAKWVFDYNDLRISEDGREFPNLIYHAEMGGMMNPKYITDSIIGYTYKLGSGSLKDITIVGIKEEIIPFFKTGISLLDNGVEILEPITSMFFSKEAYSITPIVIYRSIVGDDNDDDIDVS